MTNEMLNIITEGDCIDIMQKIDDKSIDMILCDLPYGITACKWDAVIPFDLLWGQYNRIIKENGVIVLTASQPFTSALIMSNPKMFKHEWIWVKNRGSNFANTVREPMKEHESVIVFAPGKFTYNKQMQPRNGKGEERAKYSVTHSNAAREGTRTWEGREKHEILEMRVPSSCQKFNVEVGLHPTQKPVALFEYLIKTYTNEGDIVLDNCAGSFTTAIASENTGRNWICIEKEAAYCKIGQKRLEKLRNSK